MQVIKISGFPFQEKIENIKMESVTILNDLFCETCDFQFEKKILYDIHLLFSHEGKEIQKNNMNFQDFKNDDIDYGQ